MKKKKKNILRRFRNVLLSISDEAKNSPSSKRNWLSKDNVEDLKKGKQVNFDRVKCRSKRETRFSKENSLEQKISFFLAKYLLKGVRKKRPSSNNNNNTSGSDNNNNSSSCHLA